MLFDPDGLEVGSLGEFRRHGEGCELFVSGAYGAEVREEVLDAEFSAVCASEDPALGFEACEGVLEKLSVIAFDGEDVSFLVAGEGGRIEDDAVEAAALFGEALEPVEGVALAEVVVIGIEVVEDEIFAGPIEVWLGEVESGGGGAAEGCGD